MHSGTWVKGPPKKLGLRIIVGLTWGAASQHFPLALEPHNAASVGRGCLGVEAAPASSASVSASAAEAAASAAESSASSVSSAAAEAASSTSESSASSISSAAASSSSLSGDGKVESHASAVELLSVEVHGLGGGAGLGELDVGESSGSSVLAHGDSHGGDVSASGEELPDAPLLGPEAEVSNEDGVGLSGSSSGTSGSTGGAGA
mmetsp:Transcript_13139/g.22208  ORF Transcript_13139/g.22208 Transcript_13139/m.22208 type:complete len:205 (+) Transcript_13139:326-940(+)